MPIAHEPKSAFESETFEQDASFHLDQPIGSMSISPCGRDVVLASKEGLHVVDLDSPYSPPRYLPHRTSWEVADVQWSPFAARDYWVVSTSNQKALVWNLDAPSSDAVDFVLHGHTRAITDINFSAHDPDILATCAVDSFIHVWDLKDPHRPAISFSDWFAGATQVKWNRQDEHVIASSHDKFLRIWDRRKGAYPVRSIQAHATKIYGVDWNRFHANKIVTCSLDKTIKFWNCDDPQDVPERVIDTPFPVWRARHTPFGWGCLAMPQRNNGDLHLYDRRPFNDKYISGAVSPVTIFPGHKGQVKEFLWRARGTVVDGVDYRDFQLVSWGTDRELRLHKIEPEMMSGISYEKGVSRAQNLHVTRKGARYRSLRNPPSVLASSNSLASEQSYPSSPTQSFKRRPRAQTNIGMSKVPLPQFRSWVHDRGVTSRIGMHGRTSFRQDMDPIAWMKNVKINSWDPDTLAEEITHVGEKFSKVEFEVVDVRARKATISTHGPWGDDDSSLYVRVSMRFPRLYPQEANAMFTVQRTPAMTDTLAETLTSEMHSIAEAYALRRRGCLEAILRYLLREQTKDEIVSLALDESILDSKILEALDFAENDSSDDDDDQLDDLQGEAGTLNSSNALNLNALVPLPKACGALWSDNGNLVCFFPPKPLEPPSFLKSTDFDQLDRSSSSRLFEGSTRPYTTGRGPRALLGSVRNREESLSESSDDDSSSSASSSVSSKTTAFVPPGLLLRQGWRGHANGLQRSRSADRSNRSTNGLAPLKSSTIGVRNVVSIRSFNDLIPSKASLAQAYKVFGQRRKLCEHNASVALEAAEPLDAAVWNFVKLILEERIPLETLGESTSSQNIAVVMKNALSGPSRESRSNVVDSPKVKMSGSVCWGLSPFGSAWLVKSLFEHFEVLGDVQMLAMLSCVLTEPKTSTPPEYLTQSSSTVRYYPSVEVAQSVPTRAAHRSSGIGQQSDEQLHVDSSIYVSPTTHAADNTNVQEDGRRGNTPPIPSTTSLRDRRLLSRPVNVTNKSSVDGALSTPASVPSSLSTSPEGTRTSRRSNSNAAHSLSQASLTAIRQAYSSSPPASINGPANTNSHKRVSPPGSFLSGTWSTANASVPSGSGKGQHLTQQFNAPSSDETKSSYFRRMQPNLTGRSSPRLDNYIPNSSGVAAGSTRAISTTQSRIMITPSKKVSFNVYLHNQDEFDVDGYASVPLLDPTFEWRFRAYRASYAYLLGVWGMHCQMAEIVKFDAQESRLNNDSLLRDEGSDRGLSLSQIRIRRSMFEAKKAETVKNIGLRVQQCCLECGQTLMAVEKNGIPIEWRCTKTRCMSSSSKRTSRSLCIICDKSIAGLSMPCLRCGHITCYTCAIEWFGSEALRARNGGTGVNEHGNSNQIQSCPSGCGCLCGSGESAVVPYPEVLAHDPAPVETQRPQVRTNSERLMSADGPDTAIGAFLSLSRARSISTAQKSTSGMRTPDGHAGSESPSPSLLDQDELDQWSRSKFLGPGHGRGLVSKASDATIRMKSSK